MSGFTLTPVKEKEETSYTLEPVNQRKYTVNDLSGDDIPVIRDYMVTMEGSRAGDLKDQDLIEKFINRQRGFAAGNSVRATRELVRLQQLNDEEMAKVGAAYSLFNNMEGVFSEENTWGETLGGVADYARTTLMDPANLLGLGVGKAVGAGIGRSAVRVAQKEAMRVFRKELAKGVSREAAEKTATRVFSQAAQEVAESEAKRLGARETARRAGTKSVLKQTAAVVATDTAINVGTELAYQQGMILAGEQDNVSKFGLGLAALGTITMGGVSAGLAARNVSNMSIVNPDGFKPTPTQTKEVLKGVTETVKKVTEGDWQGKVASGKELTDLDFDFWRTMLLGDEERGIAGMASILAEQGYQWQRRSDQDKVSNWIADIIRSADPQDAKVFTDNFEAATGIKMTDLQGELKTEGVEAFANVFARKMNQAGRIQNAVSQIAKARAVPVESLDPSKLTLNDYAESLGVIGTGRKAEKVRWQQIGGEEVSRFQNNTIRMIVSNLSTTNLNVIGWASASAQNSMSDFALAVFHGGKSAAQFATGNMADAKKSAQAIQAIGENQVDKLRFLLDTDTTVDVFRSLALVRPDSMRELTDVLPGGVEDLEKLLKNKGFDPNRTTFGDVTDSIVEGAQIVNLVKAQDVLTKAVEYNSQLDRALRLEMGVGLRQLLNSPDAAKIMNTQKFAELEAKAIYETQRAIFSKSYKGQGFLGETAGMIEDARNIPGIGLLVPFGRFFNNTIATSADAVGISALMKLVDKTSSSERSMGELVSRAAVTWGGVYSLAQVELENREKGLGWSEVEDPRTGSVTDRKFDFPYSLWKGMAHITSFWMDGKEVPDEVMSEMAEVVSAYEQASQSITGTGEIPPELIEQMGQAVFGQLTRQLVQSSESIYEVLKRTVSGEVTKDDLTGILTKPVSQVVSGWTRTLEPVNVAVGVAGGVDFKVMDRKQGVQLINDMFRYTDQFQQLFVEGNERKFNAVDGPARLDPTKFVGARSAGPVTDTERVLNVLGKPYWKLNSFSLDPEADNRFNALYNSMIEEEAGKLIRKDSFKRGTLESREAAWAALNTKVKETVKKYMATGIARANDRSLKMILDISSSGQRKVDAAMEELGFDDITELNLQQLELLKGFLDTREDWLKVINR